MPSLLNVIISRQLSGSGCGRLLLSDGVTSADLSVKGMQGVFAAVSIDARSARKGVPAVGDAASAAKNLDEYQFLICSLAPSLPDSDPSKLQLQKYRVAIIAAFAKLVPLLQNIQADGLAEWGRHARALLQETSDAYVKAKSNVKMQVISHKDALEYFGVPEGQIDAALGAFYGYT